MLSNRLFLLYLILIVVVVVGLGESTSCIPNKIILLSNCSFHNHMTNGNRTLSLTVPYPLHKTEENDLLITVITHNFSSKPLIRFNLNMIQCSNKKILFNWTSLESSSTLRGEFARTTVIDKNTMYLSSGITYFKNLTALNCLTKTLYRTDDKQIFQLDLRIESTLNDYCLDDQSCYPVENYQCNQIKHRCVCRQPLQSYLTKNQYPICIHAVHTIDQCTMKNVRCLEVCHQNSSSTICICPKELAIKKLSSDDRGMKKEIFFFCYFISFSLAYCESRTGEICNTFIQCPLNGVCVHETCQYNNSKSYQTKSIDIVTISIIVSCLVLFMISILLGISIYILRRQRWKKDYHSPIDSVCTKQQEKTVPTISDYDNITYGVFRNNVKLSSSDDNDSSPMTTSDDCSYEPKIVYLGGEQQLTAIFA
jgi:hypothetical protein